MNKYAWCALLLVPALAGCPTSTASGGGDNPVVSMLKANCTPYCLRYQECNKAVFDLKWASLAACEQACDPEMAAATCSAKCDTDFASDAARHLTCLDACNYSLSVAGCQVACEGITDTSAHAQCDGGCVNQFSQNCADATENNMKCVRALECERLIILNEFGGSAAELGECPDDSVRTNC